MDKLANVYRPYFDCVAVYPIFSDFYAAIADDCHFPIPDKGDLYSAWYDARAQLTGNYITHFDDNGLPVDQHNNISWHWHDGKWHCIERNGKFAMEFDRIGETEMLAALSEYNDSYSMKFTESHRASLLAGMNAEFAGAAVTLGDVDMTYASKADVPCIYVEFFVDGKRHLADVACRADGSVDWVY